MKLIKNESIINNLSKYGQMFDNKIEDIPNDLPGLYYDIVIKSNGGFTKDGFFHLLGTHGPAYHNIVEWNKNGLWRQHFDIKDDWYVFAEDLFGNQYFFKRGRRGNAIYLLDCNTGETNLMADIFENFVKDVIDDKNNEVNGELKEIAQEYFSRNNKKWEPFKHLSCKKPVILGGNGDDPTNYLFCDSLVNLNINGQLISQLKHYPPGTVIKDIEIDYEKATVRLII